MLTEPAPVPRGGASTMLRALGVVAAEGHAHELAQALDALRLLQYATRKSARRDRAAALSRQMQHLGGLLGANCLQPAYKLIRELAGQRMLPLTAVRADGQDLTTGAEVAAAAAAHF